MSPALASMIEKHQSEAEFLFEISAENEDTRLDLFLTSKAVGLSRSRIQGLIKNGDVKVNESRCRPSCRLKVGDRVSLFVPPATRWHPEPEEVDFTIIYEDDALIVVHKPPGIVVHPAPGHFRGTLVHGLLERVKHLSTVGGPLRPGIVHRIDKDTSGVMVIAKNDPVHLSLVNQFKSGKVKKRYSALVHGCMTGDEGTVDFPIARHHRKRKEMAVASSGGKQALTRWRKIEVFKAGFSLLSVSLKTGRTHQIRVHLAHLGHPVVGDPVYGHGRRWWQKFPILKSEVLPLVRRQMLHAESLGFFHPQTDRFLEFTAPLPEDMLMVLKCLRSLK